MIYKSRYLDIVLIIIFIYSVFFIVHKFLDGKVLFWDFHITYCASKTFFLGNFPYGLNAHGECLHPNITLTANFLVGIPYTSTGVVKIDGCTINRTGAGSGNITTAIYKYNSVLGQYEIVPNTNISSWNAATTGFQTVAITETTMAEGIYLLVIIADVTLTTKNSGYTTQFPYTPLGLDAAGVTYQAISKSYTYTATLPATLVDDASFWSFSNSYYSKYASFLLNQA